jgi:hypothetical protein
VPIDERTAKAPDRCDNHPGAVSVARCDRCARSLCVECAVPIRGRVLGPECVAEAIGEDAEPVLPASAGRGRPGMAAVGAAFAAAAVISALPWTRFAQASGALDAWRWPEWSLLAATAACAGLALWALQWWRSTITDLAAARALAWIGAVVAIAGVLAALVPPALAKATPVPWLAAVVGAAATVAAVRAARSAPRPRG